MSGKTFDKWVFIDESGNETMDTAARGYTQYGVLVGIIVNEGNQEDVSNHFKGVKGRNSFQSGEMKSDSISDDFRKRTKVISEIFSEDIRDLFQIIVLVINKEKLDSPGFQFPPSFIKWIHRKLYGSVNEDFHNVHLRPDEVKTRSFMLKLQGYLEKHHPDTLFHRNDILFVDSKNDERIQAADVIAGTIRRCFENQETERNKEIYYTYMKSSIIKYEVFPPNTTSYGHLNPIDSSEIGFYDEHIESKSVELAYLYINERASKLSESELLCLQFLLSKYHATNGDDWIFTNKFIDMLTENLSESISEQKLRGIIGSLRDKGLLIASRKSSGGGYKLAICEADLYEYLDGQCHTLMPMLGRIKQAYFEVKKATENNVDLLAHEQYKQLKKIIESLSEFHD